MIFCLALNAKKKTIKKGEKGENYDDKNMESLRSRGT